ncbi:MAG: hypothetical protein U1E39_16010 [Planctomycetota bacterium]
MGIGGRRDLVVGRATRRVVDGRDRVEATVAGVPVFFESSDAEVAPAVEAFAGPFLLAALERRVRLRLEEPPSATWLANARRLGALFRRWWGYDGPDPLAGVEARPDAGPPRAEGAQCFSGGIDSFHTLHHSPHRRDVLVALHGFDVALDDDARMDAFARSLHAVAAATGRRAIVLRTSIRRHPVLRRLSWDREHGSILAAAGHALSSTVGSLVIPASWSTAWPHGWGSHWESDPLWSGDRLRVLHDDPSLERWDKVPGVLGPLLFEHLRVCWENRAAAGNCGLCEKCVRTRVVFLRAGALDRAARCFATTEPLPRSIDRLVLNRKQLEVVWEAHYVGWSLPPDVQAAVERLVARSHRALDAGPVVRLGRRLRKTVRHVRRLWHRRPR